MNIFKENKIKRDIKRVFFKKGSCSRAFFYLLNREFGHPMEKEEEAADPLAGGIIQQGYQCGMLWGASLALGAESYRRTSDIDKAVNMALTSTKHLLKSFVNRAKSPDCEEITHTDWSKKFSIAKFFFTGKMFKCYRLADKWAPEAFDAAEEGLSLGQSGLPERPLSCASEVVRRMGGNDEEMAVVAGLAGGIGLSGYGCGALAASIWKQTLERVKTNDYKYSLNDEVLGKVVKEFYEITDYKMECRDICGEEFNTIKEHTEYIKKGGCGKLLEMLASSTSTEDHKNK